MVQIEMLWFFLSSNLSLPYKVKSINLFSFSAEKELSISINSLIRSDFSHYKNGNAENDVKWFWLRYHKDKEGLS